MYTERKVAIHVLILDERATHDDLRDQHERDNVGGRLRIADER